MFLRLLGLAFIALGVGAWLHGRIGLFGAAICVFSGAALVAIGGRR